MTPESPTTLFNLAVDSQNRGDLSSAQDYLHRLLTLDPRHFEAHSRLGHVLSQIGRIDEALASHRRAVELAPSNALIWLNFAMALHRNNEHDEALSAYHKSLALDSKIPETYVNLGIEWRARGMPSKAIACQRNAIQLNPNLVEAWSNLAIDSAEISSPSRWSGIRTALRLRPNDLTACSNRILFEQYSAEYGAREVRDHACALGVNFGEPCVLNKPLQSELRTRRLRIGYVSSDFYAHPVGWMSMRSILAHDRGTNEIHLYSNGKVSDFVTERFRQGVEHWHDVQLLSDESLAEKIRQDGIDVLIDLNGHTIGNRLGVFARRAAPVQLSWLGFAASSGLKAMDGIILGIAQAPMGAQEGFTERIISIPRCHFTYFPPDYAPNVSPPPSKNADHITFGSFNYTAKIDHTVLKLWSEVLHSTPNSRLILKWRNLLDPELSSALKRTFVVFDIDPNRIELRGASPHRDMLAEYADLDIALDPFPFTGGLTTCEALWMGVPVVTLPWLRPISRQGLAIIETIGIKELVANTPAEYVAIASSLALNRERLIELRFSMRNLMQQSALFDGYSLARTLEACFRRQLEN